MNRFRLLVPTLIVLAGSFPFQLLCAQTSVPRESTPNQTAAFTQLVNELKPQITTWEREADIQIALLIVVIVSGALVSTYGQSSAKWSKTVTLVLGLTVTVLTAINARVFPADYRTLWRATAEGKAIVLDLERIIANLSLAQPTGDDLAQFKGDFYHKLGAFRHLSSSLEGSGQVEAAPVGTSARHFVDVPRVYAQVTSGVPSFVEKRPSDDFNSYFVGKSMDASLSKAKADSLNAALVSASQFLTPGEPYRSGQKTPSIVVQDAAAVQDTGFTYDKVSATYTYWTLIRIPKEIQSARPKLREFKKAGWHPVDLTFDATAGLFVVDREGNVSKVSLDEHGIQLQELFKLPRTDVPVAVAATPGSVFVNSNNQLGCVVYQYAMFSHRITKRLLQGKTGCAGMAAHDKSVYLVLRGEIRYWSDWESGSSTSWTFNEIDEGGVMAFDSIGQRLIYAPPDNAYSISVPRGRRSLLASNVGFVRSIATDPDQTLLASGKKVLFYARSDNRGENPPTGLQPLLGGELSGIAVDTTDSLWLADADRGVLKGPFPLN